MFEALGQKFEGVFRRLRGQHKLSEENVKEALREVRLALLEADVNFKVVKEFIQSVQQQAIGQEVIRGVDPAQQFIHTVYRELVRVLGGVVEEMPAPALAPSGKPLQIPAETPVAEPAGVGAKAAEAREGAAAAQPAASPALGAVASAPVPADSAAAAAGSPKPFVVEPGKPTTIMMLGLQGSGKTTFCGKLARRLQKAKCKPMLVACDLVRPAAIEQLKVVGRAVATPCFSMGTEPHPVDIIRAARQQAEQSGEDVLIVDTAGRLHIDEVRMDELRAIKEEIRPDYTFLVCDAMTGQDAVNSASTFCREVGLDGVCLTKMDGDARGGAALSIRAVTGKPVVFVGTGEHPDDLEEFVPERVASRILGMGDVVSLVEKAQEAIDADQALEMQRKIAERKFDFNDFVQQMKTVRKMGPLKGLLSLIPGMGQMLGNVDNSELEGEIRRVEAIIFSMTKAERENDELLRKSGTRRNRVAKGSGTSLKEVTELIRQFDQAKSMMQAMMGGGMGGMMKALRGGGMPMPAAGMPLPPGMPPGGMPMPGGAMMPGMDPAAMGMEDPRGGGPRHDPRHPAGSGVYHKKKKKKRRKGR